MRGIRSRDDGATLLTVMIAMVVLTGLVVALTTTAVGQASFSRDSRDRSGAVHAAEAGAETLLAQLTASPGVATTSPQPCPTPGSGSFHCLPDGLPDAQQRVWALEQYRQARAAGPTGGVTPLLTVPGGLAYGIRPVQAGTTDRLPVVFGVAEIGPPGRTKARVVRVGLSFQGPLLGHGATASATLLIDSNAAVSGAVGRAHSNGDLYVGVSNGASVGGAATATGAVYPCTSATSCAPGPASGSPAVDLPAVGAADLYARRASTSSSWYDLCPDGQFHLWSAAGPCDPTTATLNPNPSGFLYNAGNLTWEIKDQTLPTATYYVHHGQALLANVTGRATFLVSRDPTVNDYRQGNFLATSGLPGTAVIPHLPGISVIADRDLRLDNGSTFGQAGAPGVLIAGEQLEVYNNCTFHGAVLALDNRHRPGEPAHENNSPVPANRIHSNARVVYDGDLRLPSGSDPVVRAWQEL